MKSIKFIALIIGLLALQNTFAGDIKEGNVFCTDNSGGKYFICPVLGNQDKADSTTTYSDYEGQRYYFCCPGCKPKFEANPAEFVKKLALPANIKSVDAEGMHFVCPVMGDEGVVDSETLFTDYQGKRYYFCCAGCKPKFEKEPDSYIKVLNKKLGKGKCQDCSGDCKK
jgi:YHS domain-containing protein